MTRSPIRLVSAMQSESPNLAGSRGALLAILMQFGMGAILVAAASSHQVDGCYVIAPIFIGSTALVFWYLRRMAIAKGYSGGWGWLALLSYVGWIVLRAFPGRRPEAQTGGFEVILKNDRN